MNIWSIWITKHASFNTHEGSQSNLLGLMLMLNNMLKMKGNPPPFQIYKLSNTSNWLVSLWLTRETECFTSHAESTILLPWLHGWVFHRWDTILRSQNDRSQLMSIWSVFVIIIKQTQKNGGLNQLLSEDGWHHSLQNVTTWICRKALTCYWTHNPMTSQMPTQIWLTWNGQTHRPVECS